VILATYGGGIVLMGGLSFDPVKDEEQFWAQVQSFAADWPPDLEELRSYQEPMTPVSFLTWAGLERWHHQGLAGARLLTILASLAVLAIIAVQRPGPDDGPETPLLAALALLFYPYWLPTSLLVYTDVPAALFVACGLFCYVRNLHLASAAFFVVAISTRQYTVTFPAAVFAYEAWSALRAGRPAVMRWLPQLLATLSLLGWLAFFGGFGPAPALEKWPRHTMGLEDIQPAYLLYALSAIGAYFVVVEFLLFRRWRDLSLRIDRVTATALVVAVLLFVLFTPYYPDKVGPLNRGLQFLLGEGTWAQALRTGLALFLVCACVLRFSRSGLGLWVVAANVAIMPLVWSPWEKYYMPTLVALWLLKAAGVLDGAPPQRTTISPRIVTEWPGKEQRNG
jgi:hypothetical protein